MQFKFYIPVRLGSDLSGLPADLGRTHLGTHRLCIIIKVDSRQRVSNCYAKIINLRLIPIIIRVLPALDQR